MKKTLVFVMTFTCMVFNLSHAQNNYTFSGYVKDASSGEELIGATIYINEIKSGTITNPYGFFSVSLPAGDYNLRISFVGYKTQEIVINLDKNFSTDFELTDDGNILDEVTISSQRNDENVSRVDMSVTQLDIKAITKIPALMGEVDVLRSIQMLPGVQNSGEGSIGFYVRGGAADQNLVLLDEATVYNASHFGGLFSVFNQDAVKDVQLYKGGIPAVYGGRLASVLEVRMKEGNKKKFSGAGGIGLIASRLAIDVPLVKEKSSISVSGRRTYLDIMASLSNDTSLKSNTIYFYDFNAKANYELNKKNKIFVSAYLGKDVFKLGDEIEIFYGNKTLTTRYNHLFNSKVFSNLTFVYSDFNYGMAVPTGTEAFDWKSGITNISLKNDYTWYLNTRNTIRFGGQAQHYTFNPGKAISTSAESSFTGIVLPKNYALEYGAFAENNQKIGDKFSIRYGLRFSAFQNIGPYTDYKYNKSDLQQYELQDSIVYKDGDFFNLYYGLEPRLNLKYQFNESSSLKFSYNRMMQYVHLTSNTMTSTPLDVWFPSSPTVKPQLADQFALGYFKNFIDNTYEASIEVYYKKMDNAIDYRAHSEVILNKYFEAELRFGEAYSYGAEFLIKKRIGRFTGWLSYTYSRVFQEISEINEGKSYPAHYDKPHDFTAILSYDITDRINLSANWFYSTGAARTMPTGRFEYGNMIAPVYSDRNTSRLPDYHRMDVALTYKFKDTDDYGNPKKFHSSLNLSIYNVYNRHNAYSISFKEVEDKPNHMVAMKTYLFQMFPSLTYNFHF